MNKIIVILGPTSSGKTGLSIKLAKKFNGEVISADSRQVYRGLNIGTGKVTGEEMQGVPHHLLDVVDPEDNFSMAQFKKLADEKIKDILERRKLPIIAGGTGFYIQAIVEGTIPPEVPPNMELREKLEKKNEEELFEMLKERDPSRAEVIDSKNKRRLVRALEIVDILGKVPAIKTEPQYNTLQIGIKVEEEELKNRIKKRVEEWIGEGLIKEGQKLQTRLSWERFNELGLEYRLLGQFLKKELTKKEMIERMNIETLQYAKRQKKWFRRDERVRWVRNSGEAEEIVREFLK